MFYRRKFYIVKNEFIEPLNTLFNDINLPNQLKQGARLIGRWMLLHNDETTEVLDISEYYHYESYIEIEKTSEATMNI